MATNNLAKIAAWTRKCPVTLKYNGDGHGQSCDCKGTREVLDERFEGLRTRHEVGHSVRGKGLWEGQNINESCFQRGCPGYTVNEDLDALMECVPVDRALSLYRMRKPRWVCNVIDGHGEADTAIEAVAQALCEWLEGNS